MTTTTQKILGFESPHPVAVSQHPQGWELTHTMTYHGRDQTFVVPAGQLTDFASVPAVLTWLVPIETGIPAAVLHDYLWRVEVPAGRISYRDADGILRQALASLGVPLLRRWLMWAAVRWGALTRPGGARGWSRDAPVVVAVTVLALPIVLPTVVLVPVLLLFTVADKVVELVRR